MVCSANLYPFECFTLFYAGISVYFHYWNCFFMGSFHTHGWPQVHVGNSIADRCDDIFIECDKLLVFPYCNHVDTYLL